MLVLVSTHAYSYIRPNVGVDYIKDADNNSGTQYQGMYDSEQHLLMWRYDDFDSKQ